jgi:hypothetical protein
MVFSCYFTQAKAIYGKKKLKAVVFVVLQIPFLYRFMGQLFEGFDFLCL